MAKKKTDSRCEIVTKKPKMVKVKAWAIIDVNRNPQSLIAVADGNMDPRAKDIPCTILIAEKHLKGR